MSKCPYYASPAPPADEQVRCPHLAANGESRDWSKAAPEDFKQHFTKAYDDVATNVAHRKFRSDVAAVLVSKLGYTQEEIAIIGDDVSLMQGTGNPHRLANIAHGEAVVDLGSGFGIDAVLASTRVGAAGRVIGVDLSIKEISSAIQRVRDRGLRNVDFRLGDIEALPLEDGSADVVISNGGFCLVPNKQQAFREVFRVLRHGGRFSISCTVRLRPLDSEKHWPSCMVVFMPLDTVRPTLAEIGFTDVVIEGTDGNRGNDVWKDPVTSDATVDKSSTTSNNNNDKEVFEKTSAGDKVTIHKGDAQFAHLKQLDMDEYFARVNIFAVKP